MRMLITWNGLLLVYSLYLHFLSGRSIKCYQCSSDQDRNGGDDVCGAYSTFDLERNQPVECLGEDAVTTGVFCFKSIQQSPRGFIKDGRWRTVVRRCASSSPRGVNWGCDWGYKENGVYWEECYCTKDGCNGAESRTVSLGVVLTLLSASILAALFSV
ncbi:uncharacterized protein LOC111627324 isoform X2 [Centruroides sculpturatus]|uniref:uncharacterized protein LOC111627324 isoform X2 n=1 Tax=Centruroides sculpturatus TaxID=218467 RepID=UPI000C6CB6EC|nr:uncharacterized protein LOC111627324 isoform X2 [Centruroides sculpturatus]